MNLMDIAAQQQKAAEAAKTTEEAEAASPDSIPSDVGVPMELLKEATGNYRTQFRGTWDGTQLVRAKAYIPASLVESLEGGTIDLAVADAAVKLLDHGETRLIWDDTITKANPKGSGVMVKAFTPTHEDVDIDSFVLSF